jgi:spore maturation protein CgeB
MKKENYSIVIFGLSLTSSWGNGHATTYRGLIRELNNMGHHITFFERDVYWYAENRDMPVPPFCKTILYKELNEIKNYLPIIKAADLIIIGSYVPDGIELANFIFSNYEGITAFYDIDTPVTLSNVEKGTCEYLEAKQISRYDLYLSFTGGPTLQKLQDVYGSPMAKPLYCSVDPELYYPEKIKKEWDLGYMGTYSSDRQVILEKLMLNAAILYNKGKFIVCGPQFPKDIKWPKNVEREIHLSPREHREFYNKQRFTLNITRADMVKAGYSPSVRLFEASACGIPIISDYWLGLETFFTPGREILISNSPEETIYYLKEFPQEKIAEIADAAMKKVLNGHTSKHRALQLLEYFSLISHESGLNASKHNILSRK